MHISELRKEFNNTCLGLLINQKYDADKHHIYPHKQILIRRDEYNLNDDHTSPVPA